MKTTDAVQVPLLGRGRHAHPLDGGCLMELVSATVGGPWTDRPLCTPPVVAQVARTVNDHTSAEARPVLAPQSPLITGSFTVLTRLIKPIGADWLELEVSTDTSQLPDWLSGPWHERQSELDLGPHKPSWTCLPVS